jgi:uncharacterized tellurite resistance protein B-like protein
MKSRARLYDAFGELIYTVSLADGMIQPEELDKIHEVLMNHPWGQEIKWSFNYEARKKNNPKEAYEKALQVLKEHGPDEEYVFLVDILEQIAEASNGIVPEERRVLNQVQDNLRGQFMLYLDDNDLI